MIRHRFIHRLAGRNRVSRMKKVSANGLEFVYEEFGDPESPPVVLIMGLSLQMIAWPVPFCEALVAAGFRVIRFDNRDIGLSGKLHGVKAPGMGRFMLSRWFGLPFKAPYTVVDMAKDTLGIMDALGIQNAHLVGASLGGMIAQNVAAMAGERVRSLTSIMSSSGDPSLPGPSWEVRKAVLGRQSRGKGKAAEIERLIGLFHVIGSSKYPRNDEQMREMVTQSVERSYYPQGFLRQFAGILADGSRVDRLRTITAPTLVIHGDDDCLIPVAGGIHTAECIPGAKLEIIEGMGHDLPAPLLDQLAAMITAHAQRADQKSGGDAAV